MAITSQICLFSSNSSNLILSQSEVWGTMEGKKPKESVIYQSALSKSFLVLLYRTGWQQRSTAYSTSNGKQFFLLLFT